MYAVVFVRAEQIFAGGGHIHHPLKSSIRIYNRQHSSFRIGYYAHNITQCGIYLHSRIFVPDKVLGLKQCKYGLIVVMGQQVSALGDTLGIYGIFLKNTHSPERHRRCKNQRNQQFIST